MDNEIITRPAYWGQKGRNLTWLYRYQSAYDLAQRKEKEVTQKAFNEALDLLQKIINYAIADARQWERANTYERYSNSQACKDDEKRLDARREKLQGLLSAYNCRLVNYGLYPTITDSTTKENLYYLHYFN